MSENSSVPDESPDEETASEPPENEASTNEDSESSTAEDAPPAELIERIEDTDPTEIADEIADLEATIDEQEAEIDALESKLKRSQADFQNYKKRMQKRRQQEQKRATEDLVSRLIDVRDNLKRGLDQDGDIREGIEATLSQFDSVLEQENVEIIAPEPGDDVDPQRHEVLLNVESDQPAGTIDGLQREGYAMAEKIIREAQVTVSDE